MTMSGLAENIHSTLTIRYQFPQGHTASCTSGSRCMAHAAKASNPAQIAAVVHLPWRTRENLKMVARNTQLTEDSKGGLCGFPGRTSAE